MLLRAADGIVGKWQFVMETDGGPREIVAEFEQNGEQVSGRWGESKVEGTFAEGKLNLAFPVQSPEAGGGTLTITGSLEDNALKGKWTFQTYGGTFRATRAK